MSLRGTTVLLMFPGRSTLRFQISGRWPLSLLAVLLLPMSMGMAARHGWEARHRAPSSLRAGMLTGSLHGVQRVEPPALRSRRSARRDARRSELRSPARSARATAAAAAMPRTAPPRPLPEPERSPAAGAEVINAAPIVRAFRTRAGLDGDEIGTQAPGQSAVLRLHALRLGESVRVRPFDDGGAPDAEAFAALSHLMRCRVTGEEIAVDPRLVRLLTQLAADYGRPIQLISGHRTARANGTSQTSQHTTGRAADIRIAGVTIQELQRRAMDLGASGVGLYPEKGFVHVDVRPRPKAYWLYTQAAGEQLLDRLAPLPGLPSADAPDESAVGPPDLPAAGEHAAGEHAAGEHADGE